MVADVASDTAVKMQVDESGDHITAGGVIDFGVFACCVQDSLDLVLIKFYILLFKTFSM